MSSSRLTFLDMTVDREAWAIGSALLKGVLFEVSSCPKPGLVTPVSMGSHRDMSIITFMASSATIAPAFFLCAQAGRDHRGSLPGLLPVLREIGVWAEKELLKSTGGVNTQRGILFAAGLLCGAAGYLSRDTVFLTADELFAATAAMARGIVARELVNLGPGKGHLTAGEQLFIRYKVTGIRGEVEAGFPSVKNAGLPALKESLKRGIKLNRCLVHTLISLMTCVEDTTILWRKDMATLREVQRQAGAILEKGSVFTPAGLQAIETLDKQFVEQNISPGGSADLLAITVGTYLLENGQFPVAIL